MDELWTIGARGDPGDRHPCLPSLSRSAARTPGARSACGWPWCSSAACSLVVCVAAWFAVGPEVRGRGDGLPAGDGPAVRGAGAAPSPGALVRCRVTAEPRRAARSSTATAATPTSGPRCWPCTCRTGAPFATLDLADGTSHARRWRSSRADGDRARMAVRQLRLLLAPHGRRVTRAPGSPRRLRPRRPGSPAGAEGDQVAAAAERVGRCGHRLDGQRLARRVPARRRR